MLIRLGIYCFAFIFTPQITFAENGIYGQQTNQYGGGYLNQAQGSGGGGGGFGGGGGGGAGGSGGDIKYESKREELFEQFNETREKIVEKGEEQWKELMNESKENAKKGQKQMQDIIKESSKQAKEDAKQFQKEMKERALEPLEIDTEGHLENMSAIISESTTNVIKGLQLDLENQVTDPPPSAPPVSDSQISFSERIQQISAPINGGEGNGRSPFSTNSSVGLDRP